MFLYLSVFLFTGGGVHPLGRHALWADTPLDADTSPGHRHLPGQMTPRADNPPGRHPFHPRRPLKWTVRILLECILIIVTTTLFNTAAYNEIWVFVLTKLVTNRLQYIRLLQTWVVSL